MDKFGKFICNNRVKILIITILLLIPSLIGMLSTKINYDILVYLPEDIETVKGQNILADDFNMGSFSITIIDNMSAKDVLNLEKEIKKINGVEKVVTAYDLVGSNIPIEVLPSNILEKVKKNNSTLMMITYSESTSAENTLAAVNEVKNITKDSTKIGGMSAMVLDTMELSEKEITIYIIIAVILCIIVLELSLDSYLVPFILLINIGISILFNMGSNIIFGQISYITKALVAVLQLGVTTDFSIFLYHSYERNKLIYKNRVDAMSKSISETFTSVIGSSLTTIAGFLVLCTMSLTLGKDLGLVMAKGVLLGVICVLTVFPVLLLTFDKILEKTKHKILLPSFSKINDFTIKHYKLFFILFIILLIPSFLASRKVEVYYKLDESLPKTLDSVIANNTLKEEFNIVSPEIILIDKNIKPNTINEMVQELKNEEGIDMVLSSSELTKEGIPLDILSGDVTNIFESDKYQMLIINSTYEIASKKLNNQVNRINNIIKKYDNNAILAGEGPLMKDLVSISDKDFNMTNYSSIACILIIMLFVLKSYSLPILLILAIEFAIFINLSIPYFAGKTLPFVAQIVLGTIQLGATIDYAILMTTTYLNNRNEGKDKYLAIKDTLNVTTSSILVSGMCFFAATFGVGIYSKLEMISSLCMLIARGALISMAVVIFILPAILLIFDKIIYKTTYIFRKERKNMNKKIACLLLALILLPINTFALTKDETIYATVKPNGEIEDSFASVHLINNKKLEKIEDLSNLSDIYNTNGNETFIKDDYHLLWEANGNDIFYRGNTKKELPIKLSIKYYLDGKEDELNNIIGKSGHITIKIKYINKEKHYISKLKENLYTPFIVTTGTMIDNENNSNIKINNGKVINNGSKYMIVGIALPGLYESTNLSSIKGMDEIVLDFDTNSFTLPPIYSFINSKILETKDLKIFDETDNLLNGVSELKSSIEKIQNGSSELTEGAKKINVGSSLISDNLKIVSLKLNELENGTVSIDEGLKSIIKELNESKEILNNSKNAESIKELSLLIKANEETINKLRSNEAYVAYKKYNLDKMTSEQILSFTEENYASMGLNLNSEEVVVMNNKLNSAKQSIELSLLIEKNNEALNKVINSMNNNLTLINELTQKLELYLTQIENGANSLTKGTNQIKNGVSTLADKSKELTSGTNSLYQGSKELNEGITMFNEQGITKLVNASNEIKNAEIKVKELIKLGEDYNNFTKKSSNANGNTKFILTIKGVKPEEKEEKTLNNKVNNNLWTRIINLFK